MLIKISNQNLDIGNDPVVVIQGDYSKDLVSGVEIINYSELFKSNICSNRLIDEELMSKIISESLKKNKNLTEFQKNFNLLSKIINASNLIISDQNIIEKTNSKINSLLELSKHYLKSKKLENELRWANFLEAGSKKSINSERLNLIEKEIIEYEKERNAIEPEFNFLQKRIESFSNKKENLKEEIVKHNKNFRNYTSLNNKLSREIDKITPTYDIYSEKIDEIREKIGNLEDIDKNEDYNRIFSKRKLVEENIEEKKLKKYNISTKIKTLKQDILKNKKDLKLLDEQINDIKPRYKEINDNYTEIISQLEDKQKEHDTILRNFAKNNDKNIESNIKNEKPNEAQPEIIRYSGIIKIDLTESKESIKRLSESMKLDDLNQNEDNISVVLTEIENDYNSIIEEIEIENGNKIKETIDFLKIFQEKLNELENKINYLLKPIGIQLNFSKIPIILNKKEKEEKFDNKFGIKFTIYNEKQKPILFNKLINQKKLYLLFSIEIALNILNNKTESVFFDENYEKKQVTKQNIRKTLEIYNNILKNNRIIYFSSKLNFAETEIEGINVFNLEKE